MRSRSVVLGCRCAYRSVTNRPVRELRWEVCVGVLLRAMPCPFLLDISVQRPGGRGLRPPCATVDGGCDRLLVNKDRERTQSTLGSIDTTPLHRDPSTPDHALPLGSVDLGHVEPRKEGGPTFFASLLNRARHGLHTGQDRAPVTGATFCSGMGRFT